MSADIAAWVQAIGSLGALGIAIWASAKQAGIARELYEKEANGRSETERKAVSDRDAKRKSWCDSVIAIIENVAEHIYRVEKSTKGEPSLDGSPMIDVRAAIEISHFRASISALRAIQLTDLRSYDAVHGVMGLANEAERILHYLDRAEAAPHDDPDEDESGWVSLVGHAAFRGLGYYAKAVTALGDKPKPHLTQYKGV